MSTVIDDEGARVLVGETGPEITAWSARIDRIASEARSLDPARVLLTLVAMPLFILGWLLAKVARMVWLVVAWLWTAALVGVREGWGQRPPDGD